MFRARGKIVAGVVRMKRKKIVDVSQGGRGIVGVAQKKEKKSSNCAG